MSVLVRKAEPGDADAFLIIQGGWPSLPRWTRAHFLNEIFSERSYFAALEIDGSVAGYAGLLNVPPEAQVSVIAVAPKFARQGHGRLLLAHLLDYARSHGLSVVTLEVGSANEGARRLYESEGFRIVGRRAKFYNDGSDAILMDLDL